MRKNQIIAVILWTSLVSCQRSRTAGPFTLSFAAKDNSFVSQSCQLRDMKDQNQNLDIKVEVSSRGQVYRVQQKAAQKNVDIVFTPNGTTAYQFSGGQMTAMNGMRARAESMRRIYDLAKYYKNFNAVAGDVAERHSVRRKPEAWTVNQPSVVNIALGFSQSEAFHEPSFFWQTTMPEMWWKQSEDGVIPGANDAIQSSGPPFVTNFFSENEWQPEVQWYEEGYFVKTVEWVWVGNEKQGTSLRSLKCSTPFHEKSLEVKKAHYTLISNVVEKLSSNIVLADQETDDTSYKMKTDLAVEAFARESGVNLIDPKSYPISDSNFPKILNQYTKGFLIGTCLSFHDLLEKQVRSKICLDRELKTIFARQKTKKQFIGRLKSNMKTMVDATAFPNAVMQSFPERKVEIAEFYGKWRNDICLAPLEKIFTSISSASCDSI